MSSGVSRGPLGDPADFGRVLDGALLHVLLGIDGQRLREFGLSLVADGDEELRQFMLLGEDASLPNRAMRRWYRGLLKKTAERLELI